MSMLSKALSLSLTLYLFLSLSHSHSHFHSHSLSLSRFLSLSLSLRLLFRRRRGGWRRRLKGEGRKRQRRGRRGRRCWTERGSRSSVSAREAPPSRSVLKVTFDLSPLSRSPGSCCSSDAQSLPSSVFVILSICKHTAFTSRTQKRVTKHELLKIICVYKVLGIVKTVKTKLCCHANFLVLRLLSAPFTITLE